MPFPSSMLISVSRNISTSSSTFTARMKSCSRRMKSINMTNMMFIVVAYLICIMAWPAASIPLSKTYKTQQPYYPYYYGVGDDSAVGDQFGYNNNWEMAQEPAAEEPSVNDYYDQPLADLEELTNLFEMYENPSPIWGQIINEKPETELEELKAEERQREEIEREHQLANAFRYDRYEKRDSSRSNMQKRKDEGAASPTPAAAEAAHSQDKILETPTATESAHNTIVYTTAKRSMTTVAPLKFKVQPGQKEVPLLRPPSRPKAEASAADASNSNEEDEPVITVAQRSSAGEKPSAYDTLRKYLSLEDALKKESEKRRVSATANRLQKRAPISGKTQQIITDVDSLAGQLSSLKKSMQ